MDTDIQLRVSKTAEENVHQPSPGAPPCVKTFLCYHSTSPIVASTKNPVPQELGNNDKDLKEGASVHSTSLFLLGSEKVEIKQK